MENILLFPLYLSSWSSIKYDLIDLSQLIKRVSNEWEYEDLVKRKVLLLESSF